MTLTEGTVLRDRYRVEGVLGQGGMGVVYAARQIDLDRQVAIKVLSVSDAEYLERFRREIRILAALSHPNVIQIFDHYAGDDTTPPFLVMERLVGRTLSDAVRDDGPMTSARVVEIGLQLTDAMSAAHAKGIVHRDIKPGNVFLTETTLGRDAIKLLDFGVARDLDVKDDLTREGAVVGTLAWLSPEQIDGRPADVATDVYAVGATLFFCLFGRRPFPQSTMGELAHAIALGKRDSATALRPRSSIARVIDRAMARDRDRRYATAAELGVALGECLDPRPEIEEAAPASAAPTRIEAAPRAPRKRRWWPALLVALVLLPLAVVLGALAKKDPVAPAASLLSSVESPRSSMPASSPASVASATGTASGPPVPSVSVTTTAGNSVPHPRQTTWMRGLAEVEIAFDCDGGEREEVDHVMELLKGPALGARIAQCQSAGGPTDRFRDLKFTVEPGGRISSVREELADDQAAAAAFAACVHRAVVDVVTFRCPVLHQGTLGLSLVRSR